jgi:heterodisulfide reductase subunit D
MKRTKALHSAAEQEGARCSRRLRRAIRRYLLKELKRHLVQGASIIATACPFCMTMMTDGIKYKNREDDVKNYDIAELVVQSLGI